MQAVLDGPMASDQPHQLFRAHLLGGKASDEVASLLADRGARGANLGVDAQDQPDAGERGELADVVDLLTLANPELAGVDLAPFFSLV